MNKNIKTIVIILLAISLAVVAFLSTKNTSTNNSETLRNFAISDTSAISKFKISDTEGNKITITRENADKNWEIEGSVFKAKLQNVNLILDALKRIVIRQDLNDAKVETVLKFLAVRHKKVEFFVNENDKPTKTWYIGNSTQDNQGTYMLLQVGDLKSDVPFIVYKPGMRGSLGVRFFTSFKDWRFSGIYNYRIGEISKIKVLYNDEFNESFSIKVDKESNINLLNENDSIINNFDTSQVSHYVTHYKKLHYSHIVEDLTTSQIDSITSIKPHITIEVTNKNNNIKKVNIWKIFENINNEDSSVTKKINPGYAFLKIEGGKELFRIQYYQWDNVLKPKSYFLPKI